MKREIIKPVLFVLGMTGLFAILFIGMSLLVTAQFKGEVVKESEILKEWQEVNFQDEFESELSKELSGSNQENVGELVENKSVQTDESSDNGLDELLGRGAAYSHCGEYMLVHNGFSGVRRFALTYWVDSTGEFFYPEGFVLPEEYSSVVDFLNHMPTVDFSVTRDDFLENFGNQREICESFPKMQFTVTDDTRKGVIYSSYVNHFTVGEDHLTFEEAVKRITLEIYELFGESIDGLKMYLAFQGGTQSGAWVAGIGNHDDPTGRGFFIIIDAVTGELFHSHMDTVEGLYHH